MTKLNNNITGIYQIKNLINGNIYIGQSVNIRNRWKQHIYELNNDKHSNSHLQNAWNLYGKENFEFSILEKCEINQLDEKEEYWINKLDSYQNGYNNDLGGKGCRGYKHTEEEIIKMRKIQNPKIILQFDLEYNFVKEWIGGVSHINKELGYTKDCILLRCNHTILNKMTPYKNYFWIYKDEYDSENFTWDNYLSDYKICNEKVICQYNTCFELIKKWGSSNDLKTCGYDVKSIKEICNHNGTRKTYKGFIWAYEGYDFSDGYFGIYNEYKYGRHNCRKVNMKLEKYGAVIKSFDSITDACIFLGQPIKFRSNICQSISKHQKSCGYYWEYV